VSSDESERSRKAEDVSKQRKGRQYVGLEIRVECESCWQSLPVNGPFRGTIRCGHCGAPISLTDHATGPMKKARNWYSELANNEEVKAVSLDAAGYYRFTYMKRRPQCIDCGANLEVDDVEVGTDGAVTCTCGVENATFPPPSWLRDEVAEAAQIFCAERPDEERAVELPDSRCPKCGADLELGPETLRIHRCDFCQIQILVPEPTWLALHPKPVVRRWFVLLE
jgi:hypothetical protein